MPSLFIIAGSNGAGKSTTGKYYLPAVIREKYEIFDGDKLFAAKRKELYKKVTPSLKDAGRLAADWLYEYFEQCVANALLENNHFVYEGHFPEDENWNTPLRFKNARYTVHMIFMGLSALSLSELRVMDRAKMGGHNVPFFEVERNYYGNLYQLNRHFHIIDELLILDTSESEPKTLAVFQNGKLTACLSASSVPAWFKQGLPQLYKQITEFPRPDTKAQIST